MPSIRLRLLKWLIVPILLINLGGATLTYQLAWIPAQSAFDQGLFDVGDALKARLSLDPIEFKVDLPPAVALALRSNKSDAVYFVIRTPEGKVLAGDADFPVLTAPASARTALAYDGQMRGEAVRVASLRVEMGKRAVQVGVAKTLRKRHQIQAAIVSALFVLETVLILASIGFIWFSVTAGLMPLRRLRGGLNARGADELAPLSAQQMPDELLPVVHAFNGLLERVRTGNQMRHDFLADVAHQLRTPLAGLRTHLEWLEKRHQDDAESIKSIHLMQGSAERMIRQTKQLLALARAEPDHFEKARLESVHLDKLVEETVQYFVEQAGSKQIDLGFELAPAMVQGDPFLLRDLIDNLIDNAIRYTPAGGVVTVRTASLPGGVLFQVEDSGPGIAPAMRTAVFNRYVRIDDKSSGTGLGLAIVRDIAVAHDALIDLSNHSRGSGLIFSVRFPPG